MKEFKFVLETKSLLRKGNPHNFENPNQYYLVENLPNKYNSYSRFFKLDNGWITVNNTKGRIYVFRKQWFDHEKKYFKNNFEEAEIVYFDFSDSDEVFKINGIWFNKSNFYKN